MIETVWGRMMLIDRCVRLHPINEVGRFALEMFKQRGWVQPLIIHFDVYSKRIVGSIG